MTDSSRPPWLPLGSLLVRERLITTEQLEIALLEQQQLKWRLGEILVNWGWVTSREIAFALAEQYGLGFLDLTKAEIDEDAAKLMRPETARSYHALPVRFLPDGVLLVAIADPTDVGACDQLRDELGRPVRLAVADESDLSLAVERISKLVA
jgi:hypothetical protein